MSSGVGRTEITIPDRLLLRPDRIDRGVDRGVAIPPDTAGAVSAQHVFNPLNGDVWFMDRVGGARRRVDLDVFCAAIAGTAVDAFDPKTVFDPVHRRFIFVATGNAARPDSCLIVAVSMTDDPNGAWVGGQIFVDPTTQGVTWIDYPSLGYTDDKITVSINLFTRDTNAFFGSTVYVVDKAALYASSHALILDRFVLTNKGGTHTPAVTLDPSQATQFLLGRWSGSSLVAFEVKGGRKGAFQAANGLEIIRISNNLGDAKSLITHPSTTTHQRLTEESRLEQGITQGMLRLSVGLEDTGDLVDDLTQALDAVR